MMYPPIFELCAAYVPLTALITSGDGTVRFWPFDEAPQKPEVPYCVWQQVGGSPFNYLDRRPNSDSFTAQVDIYGKTAADCLAVAEQVRDAIEGDCHITNWLSNGRDPDTKLYRYTLRSDWIMTSLRPPEPTDKTALLAALNAANALNEFDYTAATWAVLAAAVTAGQAIYDDPYEYQFVIDKATRDILAAIAGLVLLLPSLFGGVDGYWGDSQDVGALFQGLRLTQSVTGGPVGYRLDKSKGEPGADIIAGGDFTDPTDWDLFGTATISDGALNFFSSGDGAHQVISASPGDLVLFTWTQTNGKFRVLPGHSSASLGVNVDGGGDFAAVAPMGGSDSTLRLFSYTNGDFSVQNFTAKILPADAHNQYQNTSLSKPTLTLANGIYSLDTDGSDDSMVIGVPAGGWAGTYVQGTRQGVIVGQINVPEGAYQIPTNPIYDNAGSDTQLIIRDDGGVIDSAELEQLVGHVGQRCEASNFPGETSAANWFRDRTDLTSVDVSRWDVSALTDWSGAFTNTNLSQQGYENIVTAIEAAGTSSGTLTITGGGATTTGAAQTAVDALRARGWTVTTPDGY